MICIFSNVVICNCIFRNVVICNCPFGKLEAAVKHLALDGSDPHTFFKSGACSSIISRNLFRCVVCFADWAFLSDAFYLNRTVCIREGLLHMQKLVFVPRFLQSNEFAFLFDW